MDRNDDIEARIRFAKDRQHAQLVDNYRELKKQYDAIIDAGFTNDEAMKLIVNIVLNAMGGGGINA